MQVCGHARRETTGRQSDAERRHRRGRAMRIDVLALAIAFVSLGVGSCYRVNPSYCPGLPHNECPVDDARFEQSD
jgi:hypothetical protein